jgi:hypothetical protein
LHVCHCLESFGPALSPIGSVAVRALSDETSNTPVTRLSLSRRTQRVKLEKMGKLEPPTYNWQTQGRFNLHGAESTACSKPSTQCAPCQHQTTDHQQGGNDLAQSRHGHMVCQTVA